MRKVSTLLAIAVLCIGAGAALAASSVATVGTTHNSNLGTILVGTNHHTLYVFSADKKNKSNCFGECATNWLPLTSGAKPKATGSANPHDLGTIKRGNTEQVTYDGHPLYYYVADTASGQIGGQNTKVDGGVWDVIGTNGSPITKNAKNPRGGGSY